MPGPLTESPTATGQLVAWSAGEPAADPWPCSSWALETTLGWIGWTLSPAGLRQLRFGYRTLAQLAYSRPAPLTTQSPSVGSRSAARQSGHRRPPVRRSELAEPDRTSVDLADRLRRYAAGERVDFEGIPCDLDGWPEFARRVLAVCRSIPWGEVTTYGQLARLAGAPKAARAVGATMGRNPIPLVIPCHRVVGSTGRLVGFSSPGGVATKVRLLELEGHHPAADRLSLETSPRRPVARQK